MERSVNLSRVNINPIISVIIATRNAGAVLRQTLSSFVDEGMSHTDRCEFIIADSNSQDNVYSVVSGFSPLLNIKFLAEYDYSIYDAWNKAITKATGQFITFFGAGDLIIPGALPKILAYISTHGFDCDILSSKSLIVYQDGRRRISGSRYDYNCFLRAFTTNHTGLLYKVDVFKKFGNFNLRYSIAADYEFLLRIGPKVVFGYLDEVVSLYPAGGISSRSITPILQMYDIRRRYRLLSINESLFLLLKGIFYFLLEWTRIRLFLFRRFLGHGS